MLEALCPRGTLLQVFTGNPHEVDQGGLDGLGFGSPQELPPKPRVLMARRVSSAAMPAELGRQSRSLRHASV